LALAAGLDPLALLSHLGLRASPRFLGLAPEGLLLGELAIRSRAAALLPPCGEPFELGLMVLPKLGS
jgi:hypothetical protein